MVARRRRPSGFSRVGGEPTTKEMTHRSQHGFSSAVGLVAMAAGLLLMAVLLLFSLNQFGGSGAAGGAGGGGGASILSRSPAESQIKLCAEGRPSSYGDPPSSAQQATCVRQLLGQVSGGGP